MFRRITQILVFCINIVGILSYVNSITIEQTNGYNDTWVNMNRTCSLLGVGLTGNMLEHKVAIQNAYNITETGWILAHVKREGTLKFLGCTPGAVRNGVIGLSVSYLRIPECIYFCGSRDIFLHQNICYCASDVSLDNQSVCLVSQCGDEEHPLFCGLYSNCMCRYTQYVNINRSGNHLPSNIKNCSLEVLNSNFWSVTCENQHKIVCFNWNGMVKRDVFSWGNNPSLSNGNLSYCIAIAVNRTSIPYRLLPLALPCSTSLPGICILGTMISSPLPTIQPSITNSHPTNEYDMTSDSTSHKTSIQTPNNFVSQYHPSGTEHTMSVDIATSIKTLLASDNTEGNVKTNILSLVLGGAGTVVVIVIISVVIVCLIRNRRSDGSSKPEVDRKLQEVPTSDENRYQNISFEADNTVTETADATEDNRQYDYVTSGSERTSGYEMYNPSAETQENTYEQLNWIRK